MNAIKMGDAVLLKQEFMDPGDESYQWQACEDEHDGIVTIKPITGMTIDPTYVVPVAYIVLDNSKTKGVNA